MINKLFKNTLLLLLLIKTIVVIFVLVLIVHFDKINKVVEAPYLMTNQEIIVIKINNIQLKKWKISPKIKIDIVKVECVNNLNSVEFVSNIDSLKINVKEKDTIDLYVVNKKTKDSANIRVIGIPKM